VISFLRILQAALLLVVCYAIYVESLAIGLGRQRNLLERSSALFPDQNRKLVRFEGLLLGTLTNSGELGANDHQQGWCTSEGERNRKAEYHEFFA